MPNFSERGRILPREVAFWLENKAGQTTASTNLHPEFLSLISSQGGLVLDVGCGSGRVSRELAQLGCQVIGIDPNINELIHAKKENGSQFNIHYVQAYGNELPFPSNQFDSSILLAVLGAVGKKNREEILKDTVRCVKPGGLVYVAEFDFISDPTLRTSKGQLWTENYKQAPAITGEYGSIVVTNDDGSPKFFAHHFTQTELSDLFMINKIEVAECKKVSVKSKVSGQLRDNWNIWGYKR